MMLMATDLILLLRFDMYVCICSSVTDNEIIDCSKDGCSFEEMKTKLCVSKNCGSCEMEALRIYKEYTDAS